MVLCDDALTAADLPDSIRDASAPVSAATAVGDVRGQIADVERAAIVAALAAEGDNQTRAARRLGLSRRALIYKMEKYGLKPPPRA
jgi:two-component system response regulator AtoC